MSNDTPIEDICIDEINDTILGRFVTRVHRIKKADGSLTSNSLWKCNTCATEFKGSGYKKPVHHICGKTGGDVQICKSIRSREDKLSLDRIWAVFHGAKSDRTQVKAVQAKAADLILGVELDRAASNAFTSPSGRPSAQSSLKPGSIQSHFAKMQVLCIFQLFPDPITHPDPIIM